VLAGLTSVWLSQLHLRLGHFERAAKIAEDIVRVAKPGGLRSLFSPDAQLRGKIILADVARERDDLVSARELLGQAREWAIAHDAKELLCWVALVDARICLTEVRHLASGSNPDCKIQPQLKKARAAISIGLRISRDCGFGIYQTDLLLLEAQVALFEGNPNDATRNILIALEEGVHPPKEWGVPALLATTDPKCGYVWGEAGCRHLLSESRLLQAAQTYKRSDFVPGRFESLPEEVKILIRDAREELSRCCAIRAAIHDPKIEETQRVLKLLDGGVLTSYPVQPIAQGDGFRLNHR
jgi:hypothetical protein